MSLFYNKKDNCYYGFSIFFSIDNWYNFLDEVDWGMYEQKWAIEIGYGLGIKRKIKIKPNR